MFTRAASNLANTNRGIDLLKHSWLLNSEAGAIDGHSPYKQQSETYKLSMFPQEGVCHNPVHLLINTPPPTKKKLGRIFSNRGSLKSGGPK